MANIVFIGDEVTATGFRLAGIPVFSPVQRDLPDLIKTQGPTSDVIIITAQYADMLPVGVLEGVAASGKPLVSVIPDIRNTTEAPDMEHAVRRVLGIEG